MVNQSLMLVKTDVSSCITKSKTLDLSILQLTHYPVRMYVFASLLIISTALAGTVLALYVTGFAKTGLPLTYDLQASTIHNFRWLKGMDLQIVQLRALTWHKWWCKCQVLNTKLWSLKVRKLDVCGRPYSQIWPHIRFCSLQAYNNVIISISALLKNHR